MSKTFVIGDIHGNYDGMIQAIERSGFNPENDTLISLGDLVDRGPKSYEVLEYLSKIPKLILIKGNHDDWFETWLNMEIHPSNWAHGGEATIQSYSFHHKKATGNKKNIFIKSSGCLTDLVPNDIPWVHKELIKRAKLYYIDNKNRMFVHGGFDRNSSVEMIKNFDPDSFFWDRELWNKALSAGSWDVKVKTVDNFSEIFIGHTPTIFWGKTEPMMFGGIINMDTGGGFNGKGKVSIMDVDTHEYWQSDVLSILMK